MQLKMHNRCMFQYIQTYKHKQGRMMSNFCCNIIIYYADILHTYKVYEFDI